MSHTSDAATAAHADDTLEQRLTSFYQTVSRAMALGHFKSHHGPLEETAWLHVAIHQLDQIEQLAHGVLDQDDRCLARSRTILDQASDAAITRPKFHGTRSNQILQNREPAVVAASALLLDKLTASRHTYVNKATRYYAERAASVQQALDLAAAIAAKRSPLGVFAEHIAQLNPLGGKPHDAHGAGHAPAPAGADPHAHDHTGEPHTSDDVSIEVQATFDSMHESTHQADVATAATLAAVCHCDALTPASKAKLDQLAAYLRDQEPHWKDFLTPLDLELRKIKLPEKSRQHRCVPGQPQSGGQWEIASLRATETDELCPPGQALHDAGSKAHGTAGANLVKAQNEWINAKQCFGNAYEKTGSCRQNYGRAVDKCNSIQCTAFTAAAQGCASRELARPSRTPGPTAAGVPWCRRRHMSAPGRSATGKSVRELLDRRRAQNDPDQTAATPGSSPSADQMACSCDDLRRRHVSAHRSISE